MEFAHSTDRERQTMGSLKIVVRRCLAVKPTATAAAVGLPLGCLVVVITLGCYSVMRLVLPLEYWGNPASAEVLSQPQAAVVMFAVLVYPALETLIGQVVPIELSRWVSFPPAACVAVSACVFSAGHFFSGGLAHGLTALFAGLLLATGYVAIRPWGIFPAVTFALVAHATNNAMLLLVLLPLFPSLG